MPAPNAPTEGDETPRAKVLSLNYHEVTQDARVFKQARALARRGYEVAVICRLLDGFEAIDHVEGVAIHRFDCFDHEHATLDALDLLPFLETSRALVAERYLPYAEAARARAATTHRREALQARIRANSPARDGEAPLPLRERLERWRKRRRAKLGRLAHSLPRKLARRRFRAAYKNLYQGLAVTFAANLACEELPFAPDIVHAHDFYTLPAAIMLARRTGAKVLYDAHEYEPGRATKMPPEGNAMIDAMERDCLAHVDRMTTVGPAIADLYAKRFPGPPPALVMNTPEITDADAVELGSGRLRVMAGLAPETKLIAFTGGTQRENRGLDKMCRALAELPEFHLVALGPRVRRDDRWLMDHAKSAGVADRIHLLPPVEARDVVPTIADADLAICVIQDAGVSYRYALPNKLFEAAFARLPIVVSDLPEMRRFVEDFGIGVATDQTDPHAIASALREVTERRERFLLPQEEVDRLVREYSWHAQEERLASIILEMVGP